MKSVRERLVALHCDCILRGLLSNHYIVNAGAIWSEAGQELVRLRHTSVFQIRATNTAS